MKREDAEYFVHKMHRRLVERIDSIPTTVEYHVGFEDGYKRGVCDCLERLDGNLDGKR